jgi:hypothetical protein
MHECVASVKTTTSYSKQKDYSEDIKSFVEEYEKNKLFTIIPGRSHPSFPDFAQPNSISSPEKLKARLKKHSVMMLVKSTQS